MAIGKKTQTDAGAAGAGGGLSLNPDDFVQGGLLQDRTVKFTDCGFELFDYGGKGVETCAFAATLTPTDGEPGEEVEPTRQFWSAGSVNDFMPSEDGLLIVPTGSATALRKSSNLFIFLSELSKAGFPKDKLTNRADTFNEMVAHVARIPAPKRPGLSEQNDKGQERTVLVVDKIVSLPWEKGKAAGKTTAAGAGKTTGKPAAAGGKPNGAAAAAVAPAAAGAGDPTERAVEVLQEIMAKGEPVTVASLKMKAFKSLMKDPKESRTAITAMLQDQEWLAGACESVGLEFDGETISAAG